MFKISGNFTVFSIISFLKYFQLRDFELQKLYEQWEEDEEPIPNDELPDWDPRKARPSFNPRDFDNADDIMKASKKGQQALIAVTVSSLFKDLYLCLENCNPRFLHFETCSLIIIDAVCTKSISNVAFT